MVSDNKIRRQIWQKEIIEEIITKLREVEIYCKQGKTLGESCRQIGVTETTYYKYKYMTKEEAKRLKELEKENARLKKMVADLMLDKEIIQEFYSY